MLRAAVFGVNDGLVSNFSLVMGVAGGTSNNSIVLLAGIAGLVAGAFSMASGEWISIRSQRELYENELRIEQEELRAFPEEERDELEMIYRAKGIAPDAARALVDTIMNRNDVALDTLAREELGLDPQHARLAVGGGDLVVRSRSRSAPRSRSSRSCSGAAPRPRSSPRCSRSLALFARRCGDVDLHRPPRRPRRAAHGAHRRGRRRGHVRHRQRSSARPSDARSDVLVEVEEAVALVAELDAGVAQRDVPVAAHRGVGLLHAVVGDEHERGVVEHAGALDRRRARRRRGRRSRAPTPSAISENGPPSWNAESVSVKLHHMNRGRGYDWSR